VTDECVLQTADCRGQLLYRRAIGKYGRLQLFGGDESGLMVPILGVSLILVAFLINLSGNRMIQGVASFIGVLKIGGILIIGLVGVWLADSLAVDFSNTGEAGAVGNFFGATALGILAFKGFTTIANSGSEVKDPHRNVGRAIVISIAACVVIYTLVGFAVSSNLSLAEIIESRDYSLAAAARPALGEVGVVHGSHCHDGNGGWHSCQHICGFTHAGHVDRNETGTP